MDFPGIFREFSGENFREFSEFQKFPLNFPEIFPDYPLFFNHKNLYFSSLNSYFKQSNIRNARETFRWISKISETSENTAGENRGENFK